MVLFPSLAGRTRGFLSDIYCENLVDFLEVTFIYCTPSPPWLGTLGLFNSQRCPHWASRHLSIIVQVLLPWHWFLKLLPLVSLCSSKPTLPTFTSVSNPGGAAVSPAPSLLLQIQEELCTFQYIQLFTYCWDGMAASKLLICGTGNWFIYNV